MDVRDPQFLYLFLILPSLFGLTLMGEGLYKLSKKEKGGWLSLLMGIIFMGVVLFTFFFFSQEMIGLDEVFFPKK
ncbi:hypothetical protein ACFLZP_02950 [Patescibacteria group bacterium]